MKKDVSKKNTAIERYFSSISGNFGNMILLNVLFAIPSAIVFSLFYGLSVLLTDSVNVFIILLSVIGIMPFYTGLCHVIVRIIKQKKINLFSNYLFGIKDNIATALINGIVFYVFSVLIFTSMNLYYNLAVQYGGFYFVFLAMNIIITIAALFFFFSVFVMTVSIELTPKQIYKNSILAIFGEIKNNFLSLIGLIVFVTLTSLIIFFPTQAYINLIITAVLIIFIVPSFVTLVYFNLLYFSITDTAGIKSNKETITPQTDNEREYLTEKINESTNDDEYIFYNGKMIKRSKLKEILSNENSENSKN